MSMPENKVQELAERLARNTIAFPSESPSAVAIMERIISAELKPLLAAIDHTIAIMGEQFPKTIKELVDQRRGWGKE